MPQHFVFYLVTDTLQVRKMKYGDTDVAAKFLRSNDAVTRDSLKRLKLEIRTMKSVDSPYVLLVRHYVVTMI